MSDPTTQPESLPPAPPEEEALDACCPECGSLFHPADNHPKPYSFAGIMMTVEDFPPGYDPAEADRLIGRTPSVPSS